MVISGRESIVLNCSESGGFGGLLASYCGVSFSMVPGLGARLFPWDMPSFFFATVFLVAYVRRRPLWFVLSLPVAVLFKETLIAFTVALLFVEGSWRRRLSLFVVAVGLGGGTRLFAAGGTSIGGTWEVHQILAHNLRQAMHVPVILLAAAGFAVCAVILQNWGSRAGMGLGVAAGVFVLGILGFALAEESRIWCELVPFGAYALMESLRRHQKTAVVQYDVSADSNPSGKNGSSS